ncbi:MAG: hypothetical protein ACO4CS_03835 [bacterium]
MDKYKDVVYGKAVDVDHVILLRKADRLVIAAKKENVPISITRRIYALRNLLVHHAASTHTFTDNLNDFVKSNKKKILLIGGLAVAAILGPYLVLTRTTLLLQKPIYCKNFTTTSKLYPNEIELCINGVTKAYSKINGDVELDMTFMQSPIERVQADVVFWIADMIEDKEVDYIGEYNIDRIRVYENNILVSDEKTKVSGWSRPIVPVDVRIPMWKWVYSLRPYLNRDRPPLEELVQNVVTESGAAIATIGSIAITIYRFFRA